MATDERTGARDGAVGDPDLTRTRACGVLLHPTALPGGRLGPAAYEYVDWLAEAGQRWWQVLPLGPPDGTGSPYAASSAFAMWPGLLAEPDAPVGPDEVAAFRERHSDWSDSWERYAGEGAVEDQVRLDREWGGLRAHAARRGIRIMGDIPLYVAPGSADARAWPELFDEGALAGAPPDDYSAVGQLWGNPLHDWQAHADEGYRWWVARIRRTLELVDAARIDHFRGLVSYWAVPLGAPDASSGAWRPGPGGAPLRAAAARLGPLPLIAEDLGVITPDVDRLRDELGLPGMRVLQFGFDGGEGNPHRLDHHPQESVAYTGTHDNPTIVEWWSGVPDWIHHEADAAASAAGIEESQVHRRLIRLVLSSRAGIAIVPAQDLLGLGAEARFNTPGTASGNWSWRLEPGQLDASLAEWTHQAAAASGRTR